MNGFDLFCGISNFLIIGFGICGNVISFIVWTTGRRCKKLPGGIYLRALAVSDTVALLIPALNEAITLVSTLNTKDENDFLCKLEIFGRHYGLMVSSWIVVSFTLERTVAIFRPAATSNLVSKKGTIALMVFIFAVSFLMNIPYGIVYEIKPVAVAHVTVIDTSNPLDTNQSEGLVINSTLTNGSEAGNVVMKCDADIASFFNFVNWYHIWLMDVFLIFAIPFTLMTGSNLVVVYLLISRKRSIVNKLDSKIKAVTMRAVIISVMHCITSGSFTMSTLYSSFGTDFRRDCADLFHKKPSTVHPECSGQQQRKIGGNDKSTEKGESLGDTGIGSKTGVSVVSTM